MTSLVLEQLVTACKVSATIRADVHLARMQCLAVLAQLISLVSLKLAVDDPALESCLDLLTMN